MLAFAKFSAGFARTDFAQKIEAVDPGLMVIAPVKSDRVAAYGICGEGMNIRRNFIETN